MLLKRRNINKDMISLGAAYSTFAAVHKEAFVIIAARDLVDTAVPILAAASQPGRGL